jgi:hypothetical protein
MYRIANGNVEVLLVHPGGPFFRPKDKARGRFPNQRSGKQRIGLSGYFATRSNRTFKKWTPCRFIKTVPTCWSSSCMVRAE